MSWRRPWTTSGSWTRSTRQTRRGHPRRRPAGRQPEPRCRASANDVVIIGTGAGGGTVARALPTPARILLLERGPLRAPGAREPRPRGGLEAPALPDVGALAGRRWQALPPVHALLRRGQHQVLGQRPLPDAPRGLRRDGARRRGLAGLAGRLRCLRAVLRAGGAAVRGARDRRVRIRPRAPRKPFPHAAVPHAEQVEAWVAPHPRAGSPSLASAPGAPGAGRARALHPVQHVQLVSLPPRREERRRRLLRASRGRARQRHPVDRGAGPAPADGPRRPPGRGGGGRPRRRAAPGRGVPRGPVVRGGQLGGAAAAVGRREAPARPSRTPRASWGGATWRTSRR